jgi:tRNA nucleotidyltransferase (CCA-adding enzyme)
MQPPAWPSPVGDVLDRLQRAGVRALVVGGAIRDHLLGREVRDIDILVPAGLAAVRPVLPEAIEIRAHNPVLALDATSTRPRIELSGLREGTANVEEDLRLRDFTLNAIAFDPAAGRYVDPLGGGRDLAERRLRAADCERCFQIDSVRLLRGARLELELGLEVDVPTLRAMERFSQRLAEAPAERRRDELLRLLALADPTPGIERLRRVGALPWVLPELLRMVGIAQNRIHPDDVYRHTLRVCAGVPPRPELRLAALLHDAAKPETKEYWPRTRDFRFLRHETQARRHVDAVAERLRLSNRQRERIGRLVRHHLVFPERLESPAAVRRLIHRVGRDILSDLLELRRADLASRSANGEAGAEWELLVQRIDAASDEERRRAEGRLAIGGEAIMDELGISEGPEVGRWLRRARRRVLEHPEENERARLLAWLRECRREEGR